MTKSTSKSITTREKKDTTVEGIPATVTKTVTTKLNPQKNNVAHPSNPKSPITRDRLKKAGYKVKEGDNE